jgi:hypothetical protein
MQTVSLPEAARKTLVAAAGSTMFFGLARSSSEGLLVVEHRSIEKCWLDDSQVRTDLLGWAARSELALVECHRHLHGDPACMSWTDVIGLADWVPHVRWRIGGRPYAALVIADTTLDGLAWTGTDARAERVDIVILGSESTATTGRSIDRLESHEVLDEQR